jgi:hypothetical protein
MQFTEFKIIDSGNFEKNKIWIQLDHITSVRECPSQADRTWIELSSGTSHEVDGYADDILEAIVKEYSERLD